MISIIIPTYNRLEVLKRCINSIIPEHYEGLEIVIVDDCSTDDTATYLVNLAAAYPYIKFVINEENRGVNFSRNRGIELASNPYLMFIDSDDQVIRSSLQKILGILHSHPDRPHYMFLLSYRTKLFDNWDGPREVFYEDWMRGTFEGDFTHVVLTQLFKQYPFFEQFRMFEQLNWFRVYRASSPQLMVPVAVADIEVGRTDSLSVNQKLKSRTEVEAKFLSELYFYELFYNDLRLYNPSNLQLPLLKYIFLGVACNKRKDSTYLVSLGSKWYIKLIGKLLLFIPAPIALFGITGFSNFKRKVGEGGSTK